MSVLFPPCFMWSIDTDRPQSLNHLSGLSCLCVCSFSSFTCLIHWPYAPSFFACFLQHAVSCIGSINFSWIVVKLLSATQNSIWKHTKAVDTANKLNLKRIRCLKAKAFILLKPLNTFLWRLATFHHTLNMGYISQICNFPFVNFNPL